MTKHMYALWHAEKKAPTPEDRRTDRPTDPQQMSGFWRINGARTKPDYGVAIWTEAGKTATIFQIGRKVMNTETHAKEWEDFVTSSWLKCTAVEQADWAAALDNARWADGKPSREITNAEKADLIPTTSAAEGGNMVDEDGNEIDPDWFQIKTNLERDSEALKALGPINSLEVATKAAEIIERLRANGTEGEKRRKEEKKPFDEGAAKVQAKWVPVLGPASDLVKSAIDAITKFKRAEEARLKREAEEAQRKERERIAEEERQRLAAEVAERAKQAEAMGMQIETPSEEEIAAEAEARAVEQVATAPQADTSVRVGTAHGRAINKPKQYRGNITDVAAFFDSIKDHVDTKEWLQTKANKLARVRANVPGMTIVEE